MKRRQGFSLPLVRKPDHVLELRELKYTSELIGRRLSWIQEQLDGGALFSESVLTERMFLETAKAKFDEVMESMRR